MAKAGPCVLHAIIDKRKLTMSRGYSYQHKVAYYETDAMRIVHHSNYLRWMEVARTEYLNAIGIPFISLEQENITSPVLHATLDYKRSATFDDLVEVQIKIKHYDGLRLEVAYAIYRDEILLVEAITRHCFIYLDSGRALSLKRSAPLIHEKFVKAFGGLILDGELREED